MNLRCKSKVVRLIATGRNEKGIVLIAAIALVAILALAGTAAVITTTTDMKISSNYKTSAQAFYIAEAGIQDGINRLLNGNLSDNGSKTDPNWNDTSTYSSDGFTNSFTLMHKVDSGTVVIDSNGNPLYIITCTGTSSSSKKVLETVFSLTYDSIFHDSLLGCDGVLATSSIDTDSYDSKIGTYEGQTPGDNGNISTTNTGVTITIASSSVIKGDANSTGNLIMNSSAEVNGDANATGNLTMNSSSKVFGNINTAGSLSMVSSARIYQNANATGNITMSSSAQIDGNANTVGTITMSSSSKIFGTATAGGTVIINSGSSISGTVTQYYTGYSGYGGVLTSDCDPLDTPTFFNDNVTPIASDSNDGELSPLYYDTFNQSFSLSSSSSYTLGVAGQSKKYYFSSLSVSSSSRLTVTGNVTLYVNGNFSFNSSSDLVLASDAKLTAYVTGTISVGSSGKVNAANDKKPANFFLWSSAISSNNSNYKITLTSSSDVYAVILAPQAAININSSVDLYGAVRGKYINIASSADFHYDETLKNMAVGNPSGYEIVSWREIN
jgi:predicted acyltransferase (DUF342 family)